MHMSVCDSPEKGVLGLIRIPCSASTRDYSWVFRHDDFARHGDVFLFVSPGGIIMFVANAEAINQITQRREHFPKHIDIYQILNQFGRNVLTVEGAAWRAHRRATAASFNERNAALVFRESVHQSLGLLRFWDDKRARSESPTLFTAQEDVMRFALNIISYVGFGLRLPWPNEKAPDDLDPVSAKYGAAKPPPGFRSCFVEAVGTLLENIMTLLLVPRWLIGTYEPPALHPTFRNILWVGSYGVLYRLAD